MSTSFSRVLQACRVMEDSGGPVEMSELAGAIPCSARQLQRDFQVVMGASPRAYGQAVRTASAKRSLRTRRTVADAMFDAGYGSVRAFYDETAKRLGMKPQEYAGGGAHKVLLWSITPTAIGQVLVVASIDGLCALKIGNDADDLIELACAEFPKATMVRDDDAMRDVMQAMRAYALGNQIADLPTDVAATAFQANVWAALRRIPKGETRTYTQIAEEIDNPRAVRAVARACAMNPVALVVPCHRVIRSDGELAGYYWGIEVKEALLTIERHHDIVE
jgi:AraC family transcriptional regulator, regulatory protein of adaptative response / methylated-DNA-[protein]-cysteine methyltransferase